METNIVINQEEFENIDTNLRCYDENENLDD